MYSVKGVVVFPGPPFVNAKTESKTLSVPLMEKMTAESSTGRDNGNTMFLTSFQPFAPSRRADSRMSSGMSTSPA